MNWRKVNDEVYYLNHPGLPVGEAELEELIRLAVANQRGRARLCTHKGPDSLLQEMFIVHDSSCYVRPHKHLDKEECVNIYRGEVDIVLFDEHGAVTDCVGLGDRSTGRPFSCRLAQGTYHMFLIRSAVLVFSETTTGPFDRSKMVFAPWSPDEDECLEAFLKRVEKAVEHA